MPGDASSRQATLVHPDVEAVDVRDGTEHTHRGLGQMRDLEDEMTISERLDVFDKVKYA